MHLICKAKREGSWAIQIMVTT